MKKAEGFTLIELLVAIIIIAIMAALLYPVFAKANKKAEFATCQENLKRLALATLMYAEDIDGEMPPVAKNHFTAIGKYIGSYSLECPNYLGSVSEAFGGYGVNAYLDSNSIKWLVDKPTTVMLFDSKMVAGSSSSSIAARHSGKANIAFADGHVKGYSDFDKLFFEPYFKPIVAKPHPLTISGKMWVDCKVGGNHYRGWVPQVK